MARIEPLHDMRGHARRPGKKQKKHGQHGESRTSGPHARTCAGSRATTTEPHLPRMRKVWAVDVNRHLFFSAKV